MPSIRTIACTLAAFATPAVAMADPGVKVQDAAARMVVIPEARPDVQVDVRAGDPRLPVPAVRREGDRLLVDGGLRGRIGSCGVVGVDMRVFHGGKGQPDPHLQRVFIRGIGPLTLDRLPVITARVPLHAGVSASGAVFGHVGRSARLELANAGCGDWTVDDVAGDLSVATSGSGDVEAGQAGGLHAALSGSGDLSMADVAGPAQVAAQGSSDINLGRVGGRLDIDLAGSGGVSARDVEGPIASRQSGSGDVEIRGGHAPQLAAKTSGSGDFVFQGQAGAVAVAASGSGDVRIAHASGPVSRSRSGSGDVDIGR